ncbi:MAG: hypothetical protein ACRC4W_06750 [Treponemataceae bacterium]
MKVLLSCVFAICIFLSCTSNTPAFRATRQKLIFSYDTMVSVPQVTLSVFVLASSPYDRVLSIDIEHEKSGLKWDITDLMFMGTEKEVWFGSPSLHAPWHFPFPVGNYLISITDTSQDSARSFFDISYPEKFLTQNLNETQETTEFQSLTAESLVIYSDENEILYFGQEEDNLSSTAGILNSYPTTAYYTTFKTSSTVSYGVMMPKTYVNRDIQ